MIIGIVNGPNLNLTGIREPSIYGSIGFDEYLSTLRHLYPGVEIEYHQSNVEGELINFIHDLGLRATGILINAGAYTHTSIAIADAIAAFPSKAIEIHLSNLGRREDFRHHSYLTKVCIGTIMGLGLEGYRLGIEYFLSNSKPQTA